MPKVGEKLLDMSLEDNQEEVKCALDYLQMILHRKNKSTYWYAEVKNFGWRKTDGHKFFEAGDSYQFLQQILPDCDCSVHVHNWGRNGLAIQNFHHDSPVGDEWYYIKPTTEKKVVLYRERR